ncbi:MAG: NAD+ synthase [Chthoniobacterales bacterium]|nr:NAD+ synthase [Chthoniobacterales bacterium]
MNPGLAQINTTVGDFAGNTDKILHAYRELVKAGADFVVTPELAVCGYPPMDLVFRSGFIAAAERHVNALAADTGKVPLIVGTVEPNTARHGRPCRNSAIVLQGGRRVATAHKSLLPTYDVFDEGRYFEPADKVTIAEIAGHKTGLTICEDLWTADYLPRDYYGRSPVEELKKAGIGLLLNLSASPFEAGKPARRRAMLGGIAADLGVPLVYANLVGGNDQLVFDGHSLVFDRDGSVIAQLPGFRENNALVSVPPIGGTAIAPDDDVRDVHEGLVLGLRDYLGKCGFKQVVIGLSGGIDSAVSAALAVDALGKENVLGVTMPGPYSSQGSVDDSLALARNLGIACHTVPIGGGYEAMEKQMAGVFAGRKPDTTEENLQSRLRGMTLMAISNKLNRMVISTGNKSEMAVGYCTIYGDMAGGLALLSDVPKTTVYALARHINRHGEIVPGRTIDKAPSAELRADQKDQDTLPPYDMLDEILRLYVEEQLTTAEIAERGFDADIVRWIAHKVDANEYKRQQAAPGIKVTSKAFGIGRRVPIAQKFRA